VACDNNMTVGIHDLVLVRVMLADGVILDDILSTLRTQS
jgi:hypothetical protein